MKQTAMRLLIPLCLTLVMTGAGGDSGFANTVEKERKYYEDRGDVVWEVPTAQKVIALTFDDGPDPVYTPQILDLLRRYHAKATFFVVGQRVMNHPEITRRIVAEGHEVGNHTFNHANLMRLRPEQIRHQIEKTSGLIHAATGKHSELFRPPGGYYNETIVHCVRKTGHLTVMWSWHQDTRDWSNPGTDKIVNKVLNNARGGDIVIMHDYGGNRSQTVTAVARILPELAKRGYRFVNVSQLVSIRGKLPVNRSK
ncbi:polysaccharide deacetylase family protein [Brevibacillus sp. WF146]|uniref:polysaccharide deacetylase family protein n=1 Tax=Brevibacillus sp. WF146 TaxID=319501 RepID=UPI0007EC68DA|nr:polysaccharide deacetylase family protein [Brevibacillus sp. WF146]UYZ15267.1 polysaccharide deacetylase family protein [Brevibacillus sp. WF146]